MAAAPNKTSLQNLFPHVLAKRGCTQEDAPALEIYFTKSAFTGGDPAPPYLRIEIASLPDEPLTSVTLKLVPLRRDLRQALRIVRAELVEAGHESVWLSGSVTLTRAVAGKDVVGGYDMTTPGGRHFGGAFSAEYSGKPSVCG